MAVGVAAVSGMEPESCATLATVQHQFDRSTDLQSGPFGAKAYAGIYEEEGDFAEDTYGLALSYDVTTEATVYGAYRRDSVDDFYNALTTVGFSYDFASIAGLPISLTGEASIFNDDSTSLGDSEWNQIFDHGIL